jgi:hypothetical protein
MNFKKHAGSPVLDLDAMSSASWFDGWKALPRARDPAGRRASEDPPVWRPRTWLARKGWRRHGLIGRDESPRLANAE